MEYFFLNEKERKKYKLLKAIIKNESIEMRDIKVHLDVSSTSIRRCLFEINEELSEVFPKSNISIRSLRTGYSLVANEIQNSFLLDSMKLYYIKNSNEFIILNSLISKRYASVNQLSLQINLSPSHLYKYIKSIRVFLSQYKLDITFSADAKTNTSLIGTEIHKLYFLSIYYWDIYKIIEFPPFLTDNSSLYRTATLSPFQEKRMQQLLSVTKHPAVKINKNKIDPNLKDICEVFSKFNHNLVNSEEADPSELLISPLENFFIRLFIPEFDSDLSKLRIAQLAAKLDKNEIVILSTTFLDTLFETYPVKPNEFQYNVCLYHSLVIHIFLKYVNVDFFNTLESAPRLSGLSTKELSFVDLEADLLQFYKKLTTNNDHYQLRISEVNFVYMVNFSYFLLDYCTDTKKVYVYVELTQNNYSTQMINKNLIAIFGKDNIELTNSQIEADIILTDFYQEGMEAEKIYYFDNPYCHDSWINVLSFITTMLYKKKCFIHNFATHNLIKLQ